MYGASCNMRIRAPIYFSPSLILMLFIATVFWAGAARHITINMNKGLLENLIQFTVAGNETERDADMFISLYFLHHFILSPSLVLSQTFQFLNKCEKSHV